MISGQWSQVTGHTIYSVFLVSFLSLPSRPTIIVDFCSTQRNRHSANLFPFLFLFLLLFLFLKPPRTLLVFHHYNRT